MKWSELRRIAEKKGWYLFRKGSRHDIYRHKEIDFPIIIERHDAKEIKTGLYFKLKRQIDF